MLTTSADVVLATFAVAVVYLLVVRLMDLNEREPMWSVLMVFVIGGAAAGALTLLTDPVRLNLDVWPGAILREVALFAALALAFRIFAAIAALRGWSEVNDPIDGVLYGMAAGLGFRCGDVIASLGTGPVLPFEHPVAPETLGAVALAGLAQGVFGGIVGAGFGLAAMSGSRARVAWPFLALGTAILVHGGHQILAFGDALGPFGLVRRNLALALSVIAVAAFVVYGLVVERRVIAKDLADEVGRNVTADEFALLRSVMRRQFGYLRAFMTGHFGAVWQRAALHNKQVMLALAIQRARRAGAEAPRQRAMAEADALRRDLARVRARLVGDPVSAAEGE